MDPRSTMLFCFSLNFRHSCGCLYFGSLARQLDEFFILNRLLRAVLWVLHLLPGGWNCQLLYFSTNASTRAAIVNVSLIEEIVDPEENQDPG